MSILFPNCWYVILNIQRVTLCIQNIYKNNVKTCLIFVKIQYLIFEKEKYNDFS